MVQEAQGAIFTAGTGVFGLLAQATLPLPHDFQSWPVTAILAFLVFVSLSILCWQIHVSAKVAMTASNAALKQAEAVSALAAALANNNADLAGLTNEMRTTNTQHRDLIVEMRSRPCIHNTR
jgi:hypothetical protein